MNRRKLWLYLLIFILGIGAGFVVSGAVRQGRSRPASVTADSIPATIPGNSAEISSALDASAENPSAPGNSPKIATVPDASAEITSAPVPRAALSTTGPYPQWDKSATYIGGDKTVYENKIYRARWWTLGEIPGQADVWEDTLETPQKADRLPEESPAETAKTAEPASSLPKVSSGVKVVGYYPDWKAYQPEKLQMDILTHIVYAFAIPTSDGSLLPLEHPETAARLIQDAHNSQVKVLLAVGGWSYNGNELEPVFMNATSTSEKTRLFGDQILAMCSQYGFDGIDIDWEHPRIDGNSKDQYQELILYLAPKLHAQGKILTSAVISGVSADGNVYYDAAAHSDAVLKAVDWIHIMAYDGGDGERHSSYEFAVNCANYWCNTRQLPREKAVLGVPFYGRPGWAGYEDILAADPEAWNKDHTLVNGIDAYYNGVSTIEKKAAYAKGHLGGIMIWELTQDTGDRSKSLLSAIGKGME